MTSDSTRPICSNCGAPNEPGALICIVCGAELPVSVGTTTTTTTTTPTPEPVFAPATTTPPPSGDWRSMFESSLARPVTIPEPPAELDDDAPDLPISPPPYVTTTPAPVTTTRAPRTTTTAPVMPPPPLTQTVTPPAQPQPTVSTTTTRPPKAQPPQRPRPPGKPGVDPRFNKRRPQSIIMYGVLIMFLGCIATFVLALANVNSTVVGLVFLCAMPIGFIAIVAGIVISISRKEGRGP